MGQIFWDLHKTPYAFPGPSGTEDWYTGKSAGFEFKRTPNCNKENSLFPAVLDVRRHPPLPQHSLNQIQTTRIINISCILMSQCLAYIKSGENVRGVCLCGCICECVHVWLSVSICVCMHIFHCMYGYMSVYTLVYAFLCVYMHGCFSVCMC